VRKGDWRWKVARGGKRGRRKERGGSGKEGRGDKGRIGVDPTKFGRISTPLMNIIGEYIILYDNHTIRVTVCKILIRGPYSTSKFTTPS